MESRTERTRDSGGMADSVTRSSDASIQHIQTRSRLSLAARVRAAIAAADELSRELTSILTNIDDDQDVFDMIADRPSTDMGHER